MKLHVTTKVCNGIENEKGEEYDLNFSDSAKNIIKNSYIPSLFKSNKEVELTSVSCKII